MFGPLQDTFKLAFNSPIIGKRRPLLLYIHHDNRTSNQIFCSEIIDYLCKNFIVWPWDITDELNRNALINILEEMFSSKFFIDFSMEHCPMFIGVTRKFAEENDSFSPSYYEFHFLLINDILIRTYQKLNVQTLMDELISFKEEFDNNEEILPIDFPRKTGLSGEIILLIAEYLSLNDTITIFSTDILRLLQKSKRKLPIIEPSDIFMKTLIKKINYEKIVSLHIKATSFNSTIKLVPSYIFNNVQSFTLVNLEDKNQINQFKKYFPNLIRLSFYYDIPVDFCVLCRIINQIPSSVKRFEIHCRHIHCPHRNGRQLITRINQTNDTVEYFLFNMVHSFKTLINNCFQGYNTCFFISIIDFIKSMSSVQDVRLIINEYNMKKCLDINEWKNLVDMRRQLKNMTLQTVRRMSQDIQITEKVREIQKELSTVRQTIEFQVI
ncbi:unnamed protein product [Rotaria sordida]|uniref:Fas-associated factor 1/2-like UAS domain-containing protein n=1 Tax=Rotaria sordida TaxID=392033 RepID=A0A815QPD4_9BILA|nr:unnamed protein product [Rotaria sordida]CAF4150833.1 unnamed protein product [Rotaria sordida]